MAELDYAFLAEYAKTERGTITAVGASFTEVKSSVFPSFLDVAIAGRIRRPQDEGAPSIRIRISGPNNVEESQVDFEFDLEDEVDAVKYNGKIGSVFVFRGPIHIGAAGLYEFSIDLNGEHARTLAFEVITGDGN